MRVLGIILFFTMWQVTSISGQSESQLHQLEERMKAYQEQLMKMLGEHGEFQLFSDSMFFDMPGGQGFYKFYQYPENGDRNDFKYFNMPDSSFQEFGLNSPFDFFDQFGMGDFFRNDSLLNGRNPMEFFFGPQMDDLWQELPEQELEDPKKKRKTYRL